MAGTGASSPFPGTYRDGKTDIAPFGPSNGTWYLVILGHGAAIVVSSGGTGATRFTPGPIAVRRLAVFPWSRHVWECVRPDVGGFFGSRFTNSGYGLNVRD